MDYIVTSDKGLAMRTEDIVRSWTLPNFAKLAKVVCLKFPTNSYEDLMTKPQEHCMLAW